MKDIEMKSLYDLNKSITKSLLSKYKYPWEALPHIEKFIFEFATLLNLDEYIVKDNVWISKSAIIHDSATIIGPAIIGPHTEIRPNAYIRGKVIVGESCVIGNSTEIKNSILFDNVQVPHFNYIGDSILGYKVHLGAGAITSNVKSDKSEVIVKLVNSNINSHLIKFGAMLGDNCEIGCNTVLNPGTIVGKNTTIYPLSFVRGVVSSNKIYKNNNEVVNKNP